MRSVADRDEGRTLTIVESKVSDTGSLDLGSSKESETVETVCGETMVSKYSRDESQIDCSTYSSSRRR